MPNLFKTIAFALISSGFYSASILTLSKPAFAGEPIIDKNCRYHERTQEVFQKIPPQNQAIISQTSHFQVNNEKYALQLLKFPNSTGVLCLWHPNAPRPQRALLNDERNWFNLEGIFNSFNCQFMPHLCNVPQRLKNVSILQDKEIEKIEKDASQPATYIVTVRGEKTEDILRTAYRLNLINPNQPKVIPLIRVYKK
ncbi:MULTISPECIES: hypothetical protein [Nostoc]|uniref:Uncharacterized protein n=1 Tax=Nostoc paludosum FACHB-159 TaxID=2692908 RepID=A0ABR8KJB1_9NOSO|nr:MULTISPECIES: hypothetical protein [Nostoc]MBD2683322.1 hypothetical protein [Nostoc sp. FACHB-857]MBD2739626.1 hypothetical protein [Nostoc paludosum FACHB-159]